LARQPRLTNSIDILDTLILGIELPPTVVTAINRKIEQMYIAQEYDFRIQREQKESERKRIEAAGIHDFQATVSQGISDSYLRWRGIEATLQLAQSGNSKIVVIGSGKDGLPIILGNVDTPAAGPATPGTAPAGTDPSKGAAAASPPLPTEKSPAGGLSSPAATATDATIWPAPGASASPTPASAGSPAPTATSPASGTPPAKTPAAGAATPAEKSSAAGDARAAPAAAAASDETRAGWPFGLPDIKGILSGGGPAAEKRSPAKPPSGPTAAEPSR
jgi:hypothetical protein